MDSSEQSIERLPDASLLLNSPAMSSSLFNSSDHSSRVAAAMAENATRKRDSNGSASALLPRRKVPRGTLPRSRNVPDTVSGVLVPPQLSGRSVINILTYPLVTWQFRVLQIFQSNFLIKIKIIIFKLNDSAQYLLIREMQ